MATSHKQFQVPSRTSKDLRPVIPLMQLRLLVDCYVCEGWHTCECGGFAVTKEGGAKSFHGFLYFSFLILYCKFKQDPLILNVD